MTRQILAFFASSVLTVAMQIPSMAQEVDGTIEAVDRERAEIRLSDGLVYMLPDGFNFDGVKPGMDVVLIYDEQHPLGTIRLV
ncbi:MAG: DUF1344 domain-containing protein [Aurantimonas endophytica]|jgi:hypothetical protein|uniref:DUF1344 domain-containing protein n=1 Tax=Aurantimonas endophytica TaxID=1522175 RepID=A0A7W6MPK1_9HYPH|nr:DUF1344 domain-containing protein [Aurantimonas endophytica]MBB4002972.1 hypothetical protein [Aurantimonas endophytica]MCO6403848.1 DUF1344 domain-containing protein [Aurantimonas endophytica]